ncbi:hypothetical protein [Gryllotalpicola ginsengisoli]|uniref:hypothetical protein n=1 Tax=Gryllotalpicola ginsengisoli TaxID=444608 RepID=UPI0003B66FE1|nr:hypothetical protein [Gryllotalpicola ginsengisoli]
MADTVAEHLQVKKGESIAIVGASPEQRELLMPLPQGSAEASVDDAAGVFVFSPTLAALHDDLTALLPRLARARVVWICYPKGGRSELNRDVIARAVQEHGWRGIGNRPLGDEWSAVRVRPLRADEEAPLR